MNLPTKEQIEEIRARRGGEDPDLDALLTALDATPKAAPLVWGPYSGKAFRGFNARLEGLEPLEFIQCDYWKERELWNVNARFVSGQTKPARWSLYIAERDTEAEAKQAAQDWLDARVAVMLGLIKRKGKVTMIEHYCWNCLETFAANAETEKPCPLCGGNWRAKLGPLTPMAKRGKVKA
jgi:hypothetical protein